MTNINVHHTIIDALNSLKSVIDTIDDNENLYQSYEYVYESIADFFDGERDNRIRRKFRRELNAELRNTYAEFNRRVYDEISEYADSFGFNLAHKIPDYYERIKRYSKSDFETDIYSTVSHVFDGEPLYFGIEPLD